MKENWSLLQCPLAFLEVLNRLSEKPFIPDSWQKEVLKHVGSEFSGPDCNHKNIFIALAGARGCGKSRLAAFIALWALSVSVTKNTVVTLSANTEAQIQTSIWLAFVQFWGDLRFDLFLKKSGMRSFCSNFRETNKVFWKIFGHGDDTKIRGLHSEVSVRIIDEALGVESKIFHTILAGLTSGLNIIILLSNPISTVGFFADIFLAGNEYNFFKKNISLYACEHIDISKPFFQSHIESVKRSDPSGERYRVEILGEFPQNTLGFFFSKFLIEEINPDQVPFFLNHNVTVGIDISAGTGGDRTVIAMRLGGIIYVNFIGQIKTPDIAQRILELLRYTPYIAIDNAGLGIGVTQAVQHYGGYVHPVNGASSSQNPAALNKKAELYIQLKAFLEAGGKILIPYGEKGILTDELRSIKIDFPDGKNGKLKIGDKKLLSHSPDIVDALSYTFALNQPSAAPVYYV